MTLSGVNRDLHLGDQKITWKKLVDTVFFVFLLEFWGQLFRVKKVSYLGCFVQVGTILLMEEIRPTS